MGLSGDAGIVLDWLLGALALLVVCFRLYVRLGLQGQRRNPSDFVIFGAWLFLLVSIICDTTLNSLGFMSNGRTYKDDYFTLSDDKLKVQKVMKISYGSNFAYWISLWLIKVALLLFYFSIIPTSFKKYRITLWIASVFIFCTFALSVGLNALWCQPVDRNWSLNKDDVCFSFNNDVPAISSVATNITTDLILYCLPIPLVKGLKLNKRKKYSVYGVFAFGFICIIVAVVRIVFLANGATTIEVSVWSQAELTVCLIISCLPALRTLILYRRAGTSTGVSYGSSRGSKSRSRGWSKFANTGKEQSIVTSTAVNQSKDWHKHPTANHDTIDEVELYRVDPERQQERSDGTSLNLHGYDTNPSNEDLRPEIKETHRV